ncbi:MarR family winged helix-turn-helix transcriptional regulator [Brachybacterium sp. DNPG3]
MTDVSASEVLAYEQMLLSRYAMHNTISTVRSPEIDRSAAVLLARLESSPPMSVAELSEAFSLDVSTVHRQVAAAIRAGLIERIPDPDGGTARKHRPTEEGRRRFAREIADRAALFERVTAHWTEEELDAFVGALRRFNEDLEEYRGTPWPRPER